MTQAAETLRELLALGGQLGPWSRAALILVVTLVAAKLADLLLSSVLARWSRRTATDLDDRFLELLHRPVFLTVVVVGLWALALDFELAAKYPRFLPGVLQTVAIWVWFVFGLQAVSLLLRALGRVQDRFVTIDQRTLPLFDNVAKLCLTGAAVYFFFLAWGINVGALLASLGIAGIAVGFAARDTLANLFAGIFILADAPYKLGDYVNLESGERGVVTHIGLRSTRLLTRDDIEITVPNAVIGGGKIVNESGGRWPRERLRVGVGVAYGSDVDQVRQILLETARQHPGVVDDPEPRVRLRAFGESSLDFELLVWIESPEHRGRVLDALLTTIYKRFGTEGVEIPYPKRDVYIKEMPGTL